MTSKQDLIDIIKQWLEADEKLKCINIQARQARKTKNDLTCVLAQIMKDNEIDCVDVNKGKIIYGVKRTRSSVSKSLLTAALEEYLSETKQEGDPIEIAKYILERRSVKETDCIKIK